MKGIHPSKKIHLRLTIATRYVQSKGELIGYTAPAKLKLVCQALLKLHPELMLGPYFGKNKDWDYLYYATEMLGLKLEKKGKRVHADKVHIAPRIIKKVRAQQVKTKSFESTAEFLYSYEWRKVRMVALTRYGAKCQCCGATPSTGAVMNVDHIKPRLIYPELALNVDNLQILCHECNHGKGNWDMTDWRFENREAMDSLEEQNLAHFKSI